MLEILNIIREIFEIIKKLFVFFGKDNLIYEVNELQIKTTSSLEKVNISTENQKKFLSALSEFKEELEKTPPEKAGESLKTILEKIDTFLEANIQKNPLDLKVQIEKELKIHDIKIEKDFIETFNSNAKIISTENKNYFIIEINKSLIDANFNYTDLQAEITLELSYSSKKYDEIFNDDKTVKSGYSMVKNFTGNAEHNLMIAFCNNNSLSYSFDRKHIMQNITAQLSTASLFLSERIDKVILNNNNNIENTYISSDNSFRIRNTKEQNEICVFSDNTSMKFLYFESAERIDIDVDKSTCDIIGILKFENNSITTRFNFRTEQCKNLLKCTEIQQWLNFHNISPELQSAIFNLNETVTWCRVKNLSVIHSFAENCKKIINNGYSDCLCADKYIQNDNGNYACVTISNHHSNTCHSVSVLFNENSEPVSLYYHNNENRQPVFLQNIKTHTVSREFNALSSDEDFSILYSVIIRSMESTGIYMNHPDTDKLTTIDSQKLPALKDIPLEERNIAGEGITDKSIFEKENTLAGYINEATLYAIRNKTISADLIEDILNVDENISSVIITELLKMEIIYRKGVNYSCDIDINTYTTLITEFAHDYKKRKAFIYDNSQESYTAFLIDQYAISVLHEKKTMIESMSEKEKENIHSVLSICKENSISKLNPDTTQEHLKTDYHTAYNTTKALSDLGVTNQKGNVKPNLCDEFLKEFF